MTKSQTLKTTQHGSQRRRKPATTRVSRSQGALKSAQAATQKAARPHVQPLERTTKQRTCLALLRRPGGATLSDLQSATGWQSHSIRGFLAGTVKTKLGLTLTSSKVEGDVRRYRIVHVEA